LIPNLDNSPRRGQSAVLRRDGPARESGQNSPIVEVFTGPDPTACRSGIEPWHWSDTLTTDLWNASLTRRQHLRQRIFAILLAFVLAVLFGHVGL